MLGRIRGLAVSQERIVLLTAIALFVGFSFFLKGFLSSGNLITLVRGVSILGILGVGMAVVVIGRGIDLTIVAIYAMSAAWTLQLASFGVSIPAAMLLGFLLALTAGVINGVLIAYVEIPALFAHSGHGLARLWLRPLRPCSPPRRLHARQPQRDLLDRRRLRFRRADADPVFRVRSLCLVSSSCALPKPGRFIYAIGDNFAGGAHFGRACAPVIVLQYAIQHRSLFSLA